VSSYDYDHPDFGPLRVLVSAEHLGDWMWMNRSTTDGRVVEHYKHRIARGYINLDHEGQAWKSRIVEHACTPWCDETHEHREEKREHFTVPTALALNEVLSWLS
jgi:hypothetical protein